MDKFACDYKKNILDELDRLTQEIFVVENKFNFITDFVLIESYIYELKALHARYEFYIKLCKNYNINFPYELQKDILN